MEQAPFGRFFCMFGGVWPCNVSGRLLKIWVRNCLNKLKVGGFFCCYGSTMDRQLWRPPENCDPDWERLVSPWSCRTICAIVATYLSFCLSAIAPVRHFFDIGLGKCVWEGWILCWSCTSKFKGFCYMIISQWRLWFLVLQHSHKLLQGW